MSSTLCFGKTPREIKKLCTFTLPVKGAIARRYYDHDGTLGGELRTIDRDEILFFMGMAAVCQDADDRRSIELIIETLREDGRIDMWFEV